MSLVGIHEQYATAVADYRVWLNEIAAGATLHDWRQTHPDGCTVT
jgi:hypothetical protein